MRKNSKFEIRNSKLGFTLIELLVVIAIIGILATFGYVNFQGALQKTRDGQRKSDISQIQKALELYKQSQSPASYPAALPSLAPNYMKTVPHDPRCPQGTCPDGAVDYFYGRDATDILKYTLIACLENTSDPQRDTVRQSRCSVASYTRTEP